MKAQIFTEIQIRAGKKKDGVYTYQGKIYAVIDRRVEFIGDYDTVYHVSSGFLVYMGKCRIPSQLKSQITRVYKQVKKIKNNYNE
jgi:hypothetical protein